MRNDTDNTNILDFQDPGSLSEELLSVPGFVNGLKDHTLATTARPNEPLAFAGALAMLAHLTGRGYRDERGGRTNLYLAALAPTRRWTSAGRRIFRRRRSGVTSRSRSACTAARSRTRRWKSCVTSGSMRPDVLGRRRGIQPRRRCVRRAANVEKLRELVS